MLRGVDFLSLATTSLENGIETAEVNGDTVDSCSESTISEQTEESVSPQTSSAQAHSRDEEGYFRQDQPASSQPQDHPVSSQPQDQPVSSQM
ncbi:unnamed protein product [Gadus morhua 'NCC']